ncbi:ion channel [Pontibacter sp. MBLB2868]|uniref:ion channel n=1 Tax=Pontibacter sp. MBLB2868 TaxID=3451555 RepID=UPI003F755AB1
MKKMWRRKIDPGLGEEFSSLNKRLLNKNGTFNIVKRGIEPRLYDIYQYLSNVSLERLALFILGFYLLINLVFGVLYLLCGVENLHGADPNLPPFLNAFFFSVQTFTTVGYGVLSPHGMAMNFIVTLESLLGWVGFAIITGVVFSRFSKPNVRILYSNNALITPVDGGHVLQFRLANKRNNMLMEMEAKVLLMVQDVTYERNYYHLKLEQASQHFFPLSWTIEHRIDKDSPLYNVTPAQLREQRAEVLVLIKGYDEAFGHHINSRFSYRYDELLWGARFKRAYDTDESGEVVFNLLKLHETEQVEGEPAT